MNVPPQWRPSRREEHFLWWMQLLMRFIIGGGGLLWETILDKLRNPLALVVFGALATSTDIVTHVARLYRQAREERMEAEREISDLEDGS